MSVGPGADFEHIFAVKLRIQSKSKHSNFFLLGMNQIMNKIILCSDNLSVPIEYQRLQRYRIYIENQNLW